MNLGTLLLIVVIGVIFGIIGGALWLVLKIFLTQRKAMKDYKNGNMLKIRDSNPEKIEVPTPTK